MKKRMFLAFVAAVSLSVTTASTASAGEHTWNNLSEHSHYGTSGATKHGQKGSGPTAYAFTSHQGWADLGIAVRYVFNGVTYQMGTIEGDNYVSLTADKLVSHYSTW